ncbi:MAG: hypothetical protein LUE99_07375 [Bacteroides sp.]|nr:hypothetical protein [Bacteroides sp.]
MITPMTQAAIALLNDIYSGGEDYRSRDLTLPDGVRRDLLEKLTAKKLIRLTDKEHPMSVSSYEPVKKIGETSLLDILEATGEHLNCNQPTSEEFYMRYGKAAQKLGVVNHMTRLYLEEIKLPDL